VNKANFSLIISVFCPFRSSFHPFKTDSAPQTVSVITIFAFQLYQRLTVTRTINFQSALPPHPDDMIIFGLQLFQEIEGAVTKQIIHPMLSPRKQHGNGCVNQQQLDR
jgi:hypothetical protein